MSNANYVTNSSNTPQQYEALGPDGKNVTQGPGNKHVNPQHTSRWHLGGCGRAPAFKHLPVYPVQSDVPVGMCTGIARPSTIEALPSSDNPIADVVIGEGRFPRIPESSDPFLRSLIATQVWQDNVLRRNSQK